MASSDDAQKAIFDGVAALSKSAVEIGGTHGAAMLRDASYAFRAAIGGQQPGGVYVGK
jgi:hypothetical protein